MASKAGKAYQGVRSELWQRLRAARAYADKTQLDVAKILGVSRAAVALHESRDPSIRTRPTAEQVMAISKITGVPAEFLMSDLVAPDDVWKYADRPAPSQPASTTYSQPQIDSPANMILPTVTQPDRLTKGFWSAVEFAVIQSNEALASCFARDIDAAGLHLTADFIKNKTLVAFTGLPSSTSQSDLRQFAMQVAGAILLQERAMHKPMAKHVLIYSRVPTALPEMATSAANAFGIDCRVVNTVDEASSFLLSL